MKYFENEAHAKTLTLSDYRRVDGVEYPFLVTTQDQVRDIHTEIIMHTIDFSSDRIEESMFTEEYLEQME